MRSRVLTLTLVLPTLVLLAGCATATPSPSPKVGQPSTAEVTTELPKPTETAPALTEAQIVVEENIAVRDQLYAHTIEVQSLDSQYKLKAWENPTGGTVVRLTGPQGNLPIRVQTQNAEEEYVTVKEYALDTDGVGDFVLTAPKGAYDIFTGETWLGSFLHPYMP